MRIRIRKPGVRNQEPHAFATASPSKGLRSKSGSVILMIFCFLFGACGGGSENNKPTNASPKFTQYYNQGEQLYQNYCSNCHQKNGAGLGRVYPPLNASDYMDNNFDDVICLMRYGKKGELTVNNISFHQSMPAIPALTDLEIAEIATYIYNTWTHKRGIVEVKQVSIILQKCSPAE
jgi:cytochrome c551